MAWGGDGTINEVASALAFGDVPLGIVPAGSGNGLARRAWRPQACGRRDPPRRLPPTPRRIDVGETRGSALRRTSAGIGFDAHVACALQRIGERPSRSLGVHRASPPARCLTYRPRESSSRRRTRASQVRAVLVTAANSAQFGNGACIAPGARVDDGLLDLVIVEERSRLAHDRQACRGCSTAPWTGRRVVPSAASTGRPSKATSRSPITSMVSRWRAGQPAAANPSGGTHVCVLGLQPLSPSVLTYSRRAGRPRPRGRRPPF